MGRLYLHIGTPKTGTSMIQYFMAKNRRKIIKRGYVYPNFGYEFEGIGRNRNAHFLAHKYYDENQKRQYTLEEKLQKEGMALLLHELEQHENVVLSDEHIWTGYSLMEHFWEKLYRSITEAGHELKVVVYLRRQDLYIQSYWAQQVKEVSRESFSAYIDKKRYQKSHLHYASELDKIAAIIGQENLLIRVYEKEQYYGGNGSLIEDFLHTIGLELSDEYKASEAVINGSISGDCLEVKRILNAMPEFKTKKNFLIPVMQTVSAKEGKSSDYSRAACFAPGQKEAFLKQYEEDNEITAKKYLHKESGILFENRKGLENAETKPYSKEELILACGEMLLEMRNEIEKLQGKNAALSESLRNRLYKKGKSLKRKLIQKH